MPVPEEFKLEVKVTEVARYQSTFNKGQNNKSMISNVLSEANKEVS